MPPPPEAVKTLELLSAKRTSIEDLREVLAPTLAKYGDTKALVASIIREALRRGTLHENEVLAALEAEGCSREGNQPTRACSILVALIWPDRVEQTESRDQVHKATPTLTIEMARTELMATKAEVVAGNFKAREAFVRSLYEGAHSPTRRAMELLTMDSLDGIDSADDRAAIRRFGASTEQSEDVDQRALAVLRDDLGGQVWSRYRYAKPDDALVAEVRALPDELVRTTFDVVGIRDPGGELRCIIVAWRKDKVAPDQWQAWKELLLCVGSS